MTDYSTNAERKCTCQKWAENIKKITSLQQLALTHGWNVDIEPFNFCPYCGRSVDPYYPPIYSEIFLQNE